MKLHHIAIITSALLLGAGAALAANPGEQSASPGKASPLRNACPQIDERLQDALQGSAYRLVRENWIKVQFTLNGDQISAVQQQGGSNADQARVREAVKHLACRSEQGEQQLEFKLRMSKY
ncbi:hypothetical protein BH11PSE10_BH11PSE10_21700 [soil metagenome]